MNLEKIFRFIGNVKSIFHIKKFFAGYKKTTIKGHTIRIPKRIYSEFHDKITDFLKWEKIKDIDILVNKRHFTESDCIDLIVMKNNTVLFYLHFLIDRPFGFLQKIDLVSGVYNERFINILEKKYSNWTITKKESDDDFFLPIEEAIKHRLIHLF